LQPVEQGLGVFEVGGVKALGEPAIDFRKHRSRFLATMGVTQQPRQACRRTKLPRFGTLVSCNLDSLAEAALRILEGISILYEQSLALNAVQFGFGFTLRSLSYISERLVNYV